VIPFPLSYLFLIGCNDASDCVTERLGFEKALLTVKQHALRKIRPSSYILTNFFCRGKQFP
jgi:hypothetical protein